MTFRSRAVLAAAMTSAATAVVGGTLAYALYFRTDAYRRDVEARLTDFFQLPTEVGRIEPHTFRSRVFRDVRIWLPDRRDGIFTCPVAVWTRSRSADHAGVLLDLNGGRLSIGSDRWLPEDYRRVLRSAFSKNLADLNIRQVNLNGMDLIWPRSDASLTAEKVTGRIIFDGNRQGRATLITQSLNGREVAAPIHIFARLAPGEDDFLPEVRLSVPDMPIAALNLDRVLRAPIATGRFEGTITYRQRGPVEDIEITGEADNLDLGELTARVPFGPIEGRVSVRIDGARIRDGLLESLRFSGRLDQLVLGPLARRAGYPEITGRLYLRVLEAQLEDRRLLKLTATGRIESVSLDAFTRRLGRGMVRGDLAVRLNAVQIVDEKLTALDADFDVQPSPGRPGTIDRELLVGALRELIGSQVLQSLEKLLPERISYAHIGGKVLAQNGRIRILGASRDGRHDSLITLRVLEQEIPLAAPTRTFPVQSLLDAVGAQARGIDLRALRNWWTTDSRPAPTSR